MSWDDEKLDSHFKAASENISFDFKEEYWTEMESMLPSKKKRKFPFLLFFSSLVVCGTLAITFISFDNGTDINITKNSQKLKADFDKESKMMNIKTEKSAINRKNSEKNYLANTSINKLLKKKNSISKSNSFKNHSKIKNEKTDTSGSNENGIKNTKENNNIETVEIIQSEAKEDAISFNKFSNHSYLQNQYNYSIIYSTPYVSKFKKWRIYFDVFGNIGQSAMISSDSESNFTEGLGIGTGINYATKHWSLTAGASFNILSYSNLYVRDRVKQYGFGLTTYDTEIQYNQLYTIEAPLQIGYKKNKHIFQIGLTPSFLIGSKISYTNKVKDKTIDESTVYGYRTGLITFGIKPSFGYAFSITPTIQLGANIQFQIINPIKSELFDGTQNNLPILGQFFIRKSIFIK